MGGGGINWSIVGAHKQRADPGVQKSLVAISFKALTFLKIMDHIQAV